VGGGHYKLSNQYPCLPILAQNLPMDIGAGFYVVFLKSMLMISGALGYRHDDCLSEECASRGVGSAAPLGLGS